MRDHEVTFTPPDGGCWAWLVCAASCWTNGTVFGIINSFGVLLVAMKELEGADVFKTAWVGSMCSGLTFMMSPVASFLTDRLGCRATGLIGGSIACLGLFLSSFVKRIEVLYITYGLFVGGGFSICYTPSLVIIGHYFKKKIGLANGIVATGSAIFTIALPFLIQFILEQSSLKETLRYMTITTIIMTLGAMVFSPLLQKEVKEIIDEKGVKVKKKSVVHRKQSVFNKVSPFKNVSTGIWKNKRYRIWSIGVPMALFGYFVPFFHLVNHINQVFPGADAPLAIACLGATSGLGRMASGVLSDHPRVNRVMLQQVSFLAIGICTTLLPVCVHFAMILVLVSVMGIFDGCFVCMMGPIAFDLVGPRKASQALGFVLGSMSIPMTVGPPVAGLIYDKVKSYNLAFFLAGLSPIIGACFLMLIHRQPSEAPSNAIPEEEDEGDIGDVFYDDVNERKDSELGRLRKEPSVRRPSRKSTVTFNDDTRLIEEKTELMNGHEDVPVIPLNNIGHIPMGMKRHVANGRTLNEHSPQNGDVHVHQSMNGEVSNTSNESRENSEHGSDTEVSPSFDWKKLEGNIQESSV